MSDQTPDDLSSMPPGEGEREPAPDMREFAANVRQVYNALKIEGFTEQQALSIIGHTLRGVLGGGQ